MRILSNRFGENRLLYWTEQTFGSDDCLPGHRALSAWQRSPQLPLSCCEDNDAPMTSLPADSDAYSFTPADPQQARTLTREQVESFNSNGYLAPIRIGDDTEADERCKYFEHLFQLLQEENDDRDNYGILGYHTRCGGLWDLVTDDRILDVVSDLIGDNIVCWSSHYFNKLPNDPKSVPLHQDASYWHLDPHETVTCWLAIDPSTAENACLQVVSGSHLHGHLTWETAQSPHVLEGQRDALSQVVVDTEQYGPAIDIELKPGEMSVHSDKTVHGSEANRSQLRRCGIAIRYCPPHVRPTKPEWGQNAILCRGQDSFGNFSFVTTRPEGDDMMSWKKYMTLKMLEKMRDAES